jgi:UDP-N-acetylglucosamine 2-epimerase (non-hydrolysing)
MSMPEEVNRLVTDQLSSMHLAPTRGSCDNLASEGVESSRVFFVGNIMAESLLRNLPRVADRSPCERFGLTAGAYVVATVHRPENTDHPANLAHIVTALAQAPLPVLLPVHPRTLSLLSVAGVGDGTPNIVPTGPVGYLDMLALLRDAAAAVTDSGGVQEEACMLSVPCVTVRRNTERRITIDLGANRLAAADSGRILDALDEALRSDRGWTTPERWDDEVSARIVEALAGGIAPLAGY